MVAPAGRSGVRGIDNSPDVNRNNCRPLKETGESADGKAVSHMLAVHSFLVL